MRHGKNNALNSALAVLLSVMMVVAMLPTGVFTALAATENHEGVFTFTVTEKEEGNPVVGAAVRLYNEEGEDWTQETGEDGVAEFSEFTGKGLAGTISGNFSYEVTADGYEKASGTVDGSDDQWIGNIAVELNALTVEQKTVTVVVSGGEATVELDGEETNSKTVNVGDSVKVKITPEAGSYIKNLTVGGTEETVDHGQPFEKDINIDEDTDINVTIQKEYTVSIVRNGEGTVTVSKADGSTVSDQAKVDAGEVLTINVAPKDDSYQIDSVKINSDEMLTDDNKTSYKGTVTVNDDVKIEVVFVAVFSVTVTVDGSGDASVMLDGEVIGGAGGSVTVKTGTKIDVEATPHEHYRVIDVIVNGVPKEDVSGKNDSDYKIEGLEVNQTYEITVTFALNVYTVTADEAKNGTVTVEEPAQVEWGKDKKVYVSPADGYTIDKITVDSEPVEAVSGDDGGFYFIVANIQSDKNVIVTFKEKAKATDADFTIDERNILRSEVGADSALYVIKQDTSVTFSTDKAGIKLIDDKGLVIGGSENEKSVSVSEAKTIDKIQLYYKADEELYEDWHDVQTVKKEVFVDTEAPTVQFDAVKPDMNANGYHHTDIEVTVKATDAPEKKYSGIQKLEYLISDDGKDGSWNTLYEYSEDSEIENVITSTVDIDATEHNSRDVILKIKATDLAGNTKELQKEFHINSTVPLVKLELDGVSNVNAETGYFTTDRVLTITITDRDDTFDRNAVADGLKITADGNAVEVKPEDIDWGGNDQEHTGTYVFSKDAHYKWSFSYTNKAGVENKDITCANPEDASFYDFTIDHEGPRELSIEYSPSITDVSFGDLSYGFYNSDVTVTIKAIDKTAGIKEFEYFCKEQGSGETIFHKTVNANDPNFKVNGDETSYTFTIPAEFRGSVSFSATDKAGQTNSYDDPKIIVVDNVAPKVTVSYDNNEVENEKYYKGKRTATIEIDEANFFGTDEYGQADFNDLISGKENTYLEITDGFHTYKLCPEFKETSDGKYVATVSFDEDADYTLTVKYTDRSGNEAVIGEYQEEFTVDTTAPTIEVSFDNNKAANEKYFAADRKATIKVTEHNFDPAAFTAGIVCPDSPTTDFDAYLQNTSSWHSDGDVYTAVITFKDDGHYTFNPSCRDKAGNDNTAVDYGESVSTEEFVLDKAAPDQESLKISYSESVLDTVLETISFGFYKAPVTVTIEAADQTSGIDYFTYTYAVSDGVSAKNQGKESVVIAHSEIITSGNSASATFQIPAQFRGTVSFAATDMAGNSGDKADSKVVVVDDIAPGITVSFDNNDVRNGKYYAKDRTATITIDEANFFGDADREYLAISVTKRLLSGSKSETTTKLYPEFTKKGDTYTAEIEFNENAEYKLEIEYTDRSGNVGTVAEYQKEFVINKESPKLSISYDNMSVQNETYYRADRVATVQIVESTFRASEVEFTISATDVTGKAVDLSSKAYETYLKDQSSWTMSGDNVWTAQITLDIEGSYELNLKYENLAGTPQEKEVTDSFCIDKSKPDNLKISYKPDFVGVLLETLTFGFYKAPVEVTLEATDGYAGVDYFVYSYKVQENASKKNAGKTAVKTVEGQLSRKGSKASVTFDIPSQFRGFVSFDVFDKSGNKNSLADANAVVVDDLPPQITVTYDNNDASYEKYYNKDRVATITAEEANFFYEDLTKDNLLVITVDKTTDAGVHTAEKVMPAFTKNGDVYTGTVEFRENADYKFTIEYTDRSGNAAVIKEYQTEFTVDKTAPTVKVTYDNNSSKNGDQFKEDRTATIVITEHNFKPSDIVAKVTANGTEVTDYASYLKNADSWTTDGDVHTAKIEYTDEAHYEFSIGYSDMAGIKNAPVDYADSAAPEKFTLDKSAPTQLEITIDGKSVLESKGIAFDTFYDKAVTVKFAANCDISGLESLKYQKVPSVSEYDVNGQWIDYNTETGVVVTPSEKFIIYFRAEDRAGNFTIVNSTGIVVDDKMPEGTGEKNAPEIDIFPAEPNANGFHNGNVKVDLHVIDPKYTGQSASAAGHYSGLNEITYRIYTTDMGADVQETGTLLELGAQTNGAVFDGDRLVSSWSGSITIDAAVFNSNNTIVEITATDNAGNTRVTATKAGDIQIDVTAPEINVSYNNNTADSNFFFNEDRTATVVVTERNFAPEDVKVTITNTDGVIPSLSEWRQISAGTGNGDGTAWEATVTYSADGDYTFDITYTDLADNLMSGVGYGESVVPTEFTIDKTLPTISVSYSNNDAANEKYFKAPRTATVTINEHNFDVNRVTFTRTAALDGAAIDLPNESWEHNGDVHTATIPYTADGDYTFDVTMTDLAGNRSEAANYGDSVAANDFTVDQTRDNGGASVIGGVEDGQAYSGNVVPSINFTDVNYSNYEIHLYRTRKDQIHVDVTDEKNIRSLITESEQNISGELNIFAKNTSGKYSVEDDGIYTLEITAYDMAGNEHPETVTFTVNRFGSVYVYDAYLISLIQEGGAYVQGLTGDLIITEYNATRLVNDSLNIEITLDGRPIEAKYVADPVPNANVDVGQSGWFQYQYTVSKDNFKADGMYRITLSSEDEAANTPESNPNNSTDKDGNAIVDTMQFRVDSTAPEITSIVGLENRIINGQKVDVRYSVYDAIGLKSITVYLNGKAQDPITEFDDINNYSGTFTVSESSDAQKVRILVEDKAGNTIDTDDFGKEDADGNVIVPMPAYSFNSTVTVSTNFFVRWYANKPLFWGSIGGTVGMAAVIWILIVLIKKKKKKSSEKK